MLTLADEVTPEQREEYGLHLIHILNDEGLPKSVGNIHKLKHLCSLIYITKKRIQVSDGRGSDIRTTIFSFVFIYNVSCVCQHFCRHPFITLT